MTLSRPRALEVWWPQMGHIYTSTALCTCRYLHLDIRSYVFTLYLRRSEHLPNQFVALLEVIVSWSSGLLMHCCHMRWEVWRKLLLCETINTNSKTRRRRAATVWWWWVQIRRRGTWRVTQTPRWWHHYESSLRPLPPGVIGMLIEASSLFSCSHSPLRSTKTTTDTAAVLFQIIEPSQCARVTVTIAHFIISDYCTTMAEVSVSRKASNEDLWRFYNHREGPYWGYPGWKCLPALSLLRHYAKQAPNHGN